MNENFKHIKTRKIPITVKFKTKSGESVSSNAIKTVQVNENFKDWRDEFDEQFYSIDNYGVIYGKSGETIVHKSGNQIEAIKQFFTSKLLSILKEAREKMANSECEDCIGRAADLAILDELISKYK